MLTDISGNQYQIGNILGEGGHAKIYQATKLDGTNVVIKKEYIKPKQAVTLDSEIKIYNLLGSHPGIPKFYGWGQSQDSGGTFKFIVLEKLGFSMKYILSLYKQIPDANLRFLIVNILDILQYIHSKGVSYGDFNGANVLWNAKISKIYLTDYGVAYKFMFSGKHLPENKPRIVNPDGTLEYASIDAHYGLDVSRRGDLESFGYLVEKWKFGSLPWDGITNSRRVLEMKQHFQSQDPKINEYMRQVKSLRYDETPDYKQLSSKLM